MTRNVVETAWPIWKDQVVLMALSGNTQKEIAEYLTTIGIKMSRQNVSIILKDPRAEEVVKVARMKLRESLMDTIHDELDVASQLALKAIKKTLNAEVHPFHKAKPNQDRVALKVLVGRGFLREESRTGEQGLQVPPEIYEKLVVAMERSDRAKLVEVIPGRVEEDDDAES